MITYHYYTDNVNDDLVYEMPIYFSVGVKMSTTIFNKMFGRPTLGRPSTVCLERLDEEDVFYMKKSGLVPTRIPYHKVLNDLIMNDEYELREDEYFIIP